MVYYTNIKLNFANITFYDNQRTTPNLVGLQLAGCNVMNDAGVYRKFYPESQDIQVHKLIKGSLELAWTSSRDNNFKLWCQAFFSNNIQCVKWRVEQKYLHMLNESPPQGLNSTPIFFQNKGWSGIECSSRKTREWKGCRLNFLPRLKLINFRQVRLC